MNESFRNTVVQFLRVYKEQILGITETTFTKRRDGSLKEQFHILPEPYAYINLMIPQDSYSINKQLLKISGHRDIKLHVDWSHLNSSQILCINYFYKFLYNVDLLKQLLKLWNINETPIDAKFEYIVPNERSNIDFVINLVNGKHVFCEIKYTEGRFNPARLYVKNKDTDEIKDMRSTYIQRYNNFYGNVEISNEDYFVHYQAVRNIHFACDGNYTVFLFPVSDIPAHKNLQSAFKAVKNIDEFNVRSESWEDLLKTIPDKAIQKKHFPYI